MNKKKSSGWWPSAAAAFLFLLLWQAATLLLTIPDWMLPSPLAILQEGIASFPRLWFHTKFTIQLTILGFALGVGTGFSLAIILHFFPFVRTALYPFLILSQNIPIIALAPLLMLWFGYGLLPKLLMIVIVCFFPLTLSMLNGFAQTDAAMYNYMQMSGANRWQLFWKLELPYTVPFVFSGLKIASTYGVMAAFIAEWLGSNQGIGAYMIIAKSAFRADRVFLGISVIVCLSMLLFGIIALLEKRFMRWNRVPKRKGR